MPAMVNGALQAETSTCFCAAGERLPAASLTTSCTSYPPATSGTNDGATAAGLFSVAVLVAGAAAIDHRYANGATAAQAEFGSSNDASPSATGTPVTPPA